MLSINLSINRKERVKGKRNVTLNKKKQALLLLLHCTRDMAIENNKDLFFFSIVYVRISAVSANAKSELVTRYFASTGYTAADYSRRFIGRHYTHLLYNFVEVLRDGH